MQELLKPVECHIMNHNNKYVINLILNLYVGYDASIFFSNMLSLLTGASEMIIMSDNMEQENETVIAISCQKNQKADIEKALIIDETGNF